MNTYRTKDGSDQALIDIGVTKNGTITTDKIIENPNFELVKEAPVETPLPVQPPVIAPVVPPVQPQIAPASPTNVQETNQ